MRKLWADVEACRVCEHLQENVTQKVFGDGNVSADVMLVGEGPGAEEDASGHPFVGDAGILLTDILRHSGFPNREEIFICNAVKCRCWSKKGIVVKNRKPNEKELAACRPFLSAQLQIVRPKVVVGLGGTAIAALKNMKLKDVKSTKLAGFTERGKNAMYMWTYHPSYPIYRGRDVALIEQMVSHFVKVKEMSRA
jgi:DNA polymerase